MEIFGKNLRILFFTLVIISCGVGYKMSNHFDEVPRNWEIPKFNPHDKNFICEIEAKKLPVVDAEADAWFREARALEDPDIFPENRETSRIVQLTRKAAERRHWKAMLNLASMYIDGLDPKHNEEDAVILVESGVRLGIPAAYDRMGTFYANGIAGLSNEEKAYAFWQHAARTGNSQAQSYLGKRLNTGVEYGTRWSNIPVAIRMIECAFSQGDASALLDLSYLYRTEYAQDGKEIGWMTPTAKERALRILHEGVKLGCKECARDLAVDFRKPIDMSYMLVPHVDQARAARYSELSDALSFNPYRRFPNLDKILPLPPADLPPWDGMRESLLKAAMGVTFSPSLPPETIRPLGDRYFVDPAYRLRKTAEITDATKAPFGGYWQPLVNGNPIPDKPPALYEKDEPFVTIFVSGDYGYRAATGVVWVRHITVRHSEFYVDPVAVPGLTRKVQRPSKSVACHSHEDCNASGIWQPWIAETHPLQTIVNQPWRQVFLLKGQPFPHPQRDWLLDLDEKEVTWHLMEETAPGMVRKSGGSDEA